MMNIEIDDLTRPEVVALLEEHMENMRAWSPPGSIHALDLRKLRSPDITFWTIWKEGQLMGCGALKELSRDHGEVKSMRTPSARRGQGAGRRVLAHIIEVARDRNYRTLSLETGSQSHFLPARRLYESHGFRYCAAFGDYRPDTNSVFMQLRLE